MFLLASTNENKEFGYTRYPSKTTVFELARFPDIIIKLNFSNKGEERGGLYRGDSISRKTNDPLIREILKNYNLDLLILPRSQYFAFNFDDFIVQNFFEQKIDLTLPDDKGPDWLSHGYSYAIANLSDDVDVVKNLKEILFQLTVFMCKTGFWDIQPPNIPLYFQDGIPVGLVLVDTNDLFNYKNEPDYNMLTSAIEGLGRLVNLLVDQPDHDDLVCSLLVDIRKAYLGFCSDSMQAWDSYEYGNSFSEEKYKTFDELLKNKCGYEAN